MLEFNKLRGRYHLPRFIDHCSFDVSSQKLDAIDPPKKFSAICLLFTPGFKEDEDANVLFIRRSKHVRTHKNQIALAGGRNEGKESIVETALRELEEEVGLAPTDVGVLGYASGAATSIFNEAVYTIIGETDKTIDHLTMNPHEVQDIIMVPWRYIAADYCESFSFNIYGQWRQSVLYKTPYCEIWGLTAGILKILNLRGE